MSNEILTFTPAFGLQESVQYNTTIFEGDSGKEKRHKKWSRGKRSLSAALHEEDEDAIDTIWDFYCDRAGRYDSFWIKFPTRKNSKSTDEAVGAGDGDETVFALDYFPIDTSSIVVKHDGVVQASGFTPANDLTDEVAEITYSSAPGLGVAITASYDYYVRVRFAEDKMTRERISVALYNSSLEFIEDLWDTYSAPGV